ncbi:TetR/AcrR family transcriptional regulator [Microbacterium sp. 18062]|uniref:TetR/AcrR family transcriptional regulator n=1 Tax=Microbacterium sp. 18062 TaxID=2681410 RepID=UPI00135CE235|nr:TetR/AcrR family transcriptional regulator [Microbacterium sp. 18062]
MTQVPGLRPPVQERSRRSLERILNAGADVLSERGYEGFSIAEVCQRAQISSGALYSRFDGKDSLILGIHTHVLGRIDADAREMYQPGPQWDGLSVTQTIELAVRLLVDHFTKHAAILGVFIIMTANDSRLRQNTAEPAQAISGAFRDRLLAHSAEFPHPDPAAAVDAIFSLAFESLAHHVAFGGEFWNQPPHPMAEIAHLLPRLARLHLLTPPDPAA